MRKTWSRSNRLMRARRLARERLVAIRRAEDRTAAFRMMNGILIDHKRSGRDKFTGAKLGIIALLWKPFSLSFAAKVAEKLFPYIEGNVAKLTLPPEIPNGND